MSKIKSIKVGKGKFECKITDNSKQKQRSNKDIIIETQKTQILRLRKQVKNMEAKLIALGH